jgi:hypothetical protein
MDYAERLSGTSERPGDGRRAQKPAAIIGCPVCVTDIARISAVRVQHGQCTVTYRCVESGHVEDWLLP